MTTAFNAYGIIITLAFLLGILLFDHLAQQKKLDQKIIWNLVFIAISSGLIGARFYHVIHFWEFYISQPIKILYVWNGGLGIFGGILAALTCSTIYLYKNHKLKELYQYSDIAAVAMPLAQAVGRWANYFNLEHIPFFLFESAFDLVLFLELYLANKYLNPRKGTVTYLYLLGYGLIRLVTEPSKTSSWNVGTINIAQGVSTLLICWATIMLIYLRYGNRKRSTNS